ncbi:MAG: acyltransferase family protein [Flavobacteriales bacterium]
MSRMASTSATSRLHAFDGLRAVCAMGVFLHHHGPSIVALDHPVLQGLFHAGYLALGPFFVLSGYLITDRYLAMQGRAWRAYFIWRAARILPLLVLVTTLAFVVNVQKGTMTLGEAMPLYLANISTVKGWFDDLKFSGIVQTWSITPEVVFYLAAPLLFIGLRRWAWRFLIALPIILAVFGATLVVWLDGRGLWGFMRSFEFMFACIFFGRATEFVVGMAVAWYVRNHAPRTGGAWMTSLGTGVTLLSLLIITSTRWTFAQSGGVLLVDLLWPVFGLGPLFLGLVSERTWLRSALSQPLITMMGRCSYAFYLIHLGVVYNVLYLLTGGFLTTLVLLFLLSWVLHRVVEEPVVRWARMRWSG